MWAVSSVHCFERRSVADLTAPHALPAETTRTAAAPVLRCRHCGHVITEPAARMEIAGQHRHCFSNPHGIEFQIGCFQAAPGLVCEGGASDFWTWFPGYRWRVGLCSQCGLHLGWCFEGSGRFYGLILARLVMVSEPGQQH